MITGTTEMSYRYVCGWDTGFGFTQFIRIRHQRTYFCINYPRRARARLEAYLQHDPMLAHREFFFDALAADDGLKQWQLNIGERRASLLRYVRPSPSPPPSSLDAERNRGTQVRRRRY